MRLSEQPLEEAIPSFADPDTAQWRVRVIETGYEAYYNVKYIADIMKDRAEALGYKASVAPINREPIDQWLPYKDD